MILGGTLMHKHKWRKIAIDGDSPLVGNIVFIDDLLVTIHCDKCGKEKQISYREWYHIKSKQID